MPLASTLREVLDSLDLRSPSSEFSPLENPYHSPLGYSQGITYNFTEPKDEYPPLLVSKRILELLSHIIKHNASVTDDLLRVEQVEEEKKIEVVDLNKMKAPVGELFDLVGSTVFAQNSSVHIDYLLNALVLVTKVLIAKQKKREKKDTAAAIPTTATTTTETAATETTEATTTTTAETAPTTTEAKAEAKVEEKPKEEPKPEDTTPIKILLSDSHQSKHISHTHIY